MVFFMSYLQKDEVDDLFEWMFAYCKKIEEKDQDRLAYYVKYLL